MNNFVNIRRKTKAYSNSWNQSTCLDDSGVIDDTQSIKATCRPTIVIERTVALGHKRNRSSCSADSRVMDGTQSIKATLDPAIHGSLMSRRVTQCNASYYLRKKQ